MKDIYEVLPPELRAEKMSMEEVARLPYLVIHEARVVDGNYGRYIWARCQSPTGDWFIMVSGARQIVEVIDVAKEAVPFKCRVVRSGRSWRLVSAANA